MSTPDPIPAPMPVPMPIQETACCGGVVPVFEGVYLFSPAGQLLSYNAGAARIHGLEADPAALGRLPLAALFAPTTLADLEGDLAALPGLAAPPSPRRGAGLHRDGSPLSLRILPFIHRVEGAEHLGWSVLDVTEQARTEEALRESEARYRALFDRMSNGVAVYATPDGGRTFVFTDMNEAGERLSRVWREEILGRSLEEVFPHVREMGLLPMLERVYRSGEPEHLPVVLYQDERLAVWVENRVYRLPSGEVVAVYEDVTERRQAEEAMRRSEERFHLALNGSSDGIWDWDLSTNAIYYSPRWKTMLGYGETELADSVQTFADLLHPADAARVWRAIEEYRAGRREQYHVEFRMRHKDGGYRDILSRGAAIRDGEGRPVRMVGTHVDITEMRAALHHLRLAAAVFESTREGVIITDTEGSIVAVNTAFTHITGFSEAEALGRNPRMLRSNYHNASFFESMWSGILRRGYWRGEVWNRRKNGEVYPQWITISQVRREDGELTNYVGVFTDLSEMKASEERLDFLAYHDPLTGLPNRLLFNAQLAHALEHAIREEAMVAVLFLDLDRFKNINDSYGHALGDELILQTSRRIRETLRQEDIVSRIGGDEFMVLIERVRAPEDAALVARKLMQAIGEPLRLDNTGEDPRDGLGEGQEVFLTASIGISLYPRDGDTTHALIKNADAAMYRAKEDGRNTFQFYTEELTARAFERVYFESRLRRALERGELLFHYQPQIDLVTRRVIGAEALIRWQHPDMGMIPPSRFIPLAEESGLILAIGDWALEQVCADLRGWLDAGLLPGRIAVNVSSQQFLRGEIDQVLRKTLKHHRLTGSALELEVTESLLMSPDGTVIETLGRLRRMGITLAVDDFGTGYSSLAYLKRLPLDRLKIDQSFVRDAPYDGNDAAIIRAILGMGRSLGLEVVAEGVETEDQEGFLLAEGCTLVQGFRFGRPLPAEGFARLLATQ